MMIAFVLALSFISTGQIGRTDLSQSLANSPDSVFSFYSNLYGKNMVNSHHYLTTESPSVNIVSSWVNILRHTVESSAAKLHDIDVGYLLGVIQSETKIVVDEDWKKALSKLMIGKQGEIHIDLSSKPVHQKTEYGTWVLKQSNLSIGASGQLFLNGISLCNLNDNQYTEVLPSKPECIDAITTRERLIIVDYNHNGAPGRVVAIDIEKKNVIWSSELFSLNTLTSTGPGLTGVYHSVRMKVSKDVLVVYGISTFGLYIESFHITSGKAHMRFATNLWTTNIIDKLKR